jgi:large subunit ribosomal protein L3
MSIGILGKKLGMSQFFDDEGRSIPVTADRGWSLPHHPTASPPAQTATTPFSWASATSATSSSTSQPRATWPRQARGLRHLKEYRVDSVDGLELGGAVTVAAFEPGQKVDVSGDTMGRGFAGYQKRHGFSRGPMTHGSKNHREPGSTGAGTTPGRVYPGKRMAGRYGGKQTTTRASRPILKVDIERNLLVVKGRFPASPAPCSTSVPAKRVGAKCRAAEDDDKWLTVCIRDWQGKEAGKATLELKVAKESSAKRSGAPRRGAPAGPCPPGHRQHPHPRRGGRRSPQALQAEGHRSRPSGFDSHPLRPGGGVVFGPKPRTYSLAMNRKERRLALRTALMSRTADITVVKGFGAGLDTPKTKEITAALEPLRHCADGSKVLVVLDDPSEAVRLSVRNLEKVKLIAADQLNVFDLLNANASW